MEETLLNDLLSAIESLPKMPPKTTIKVDKWYFDYLKSLPASEPSSIYGIPVVISSLFPVTLPDGRVVHGVVYTEAENISDNPKTVYIIEKPTPPISDPSPPPPTP